MKRLLIALTVSAAVVGLGACAEGYYGHGPGPGGGVAYYEHEPIGYDGFYDDFYGPFYDGYWGNDGGFYYSTGEGHPYVRDGANHFRHESMDGMHPFHGGMHTGGAGAHVGGGEHRP